MKAIAAYIQGITWSVKNIKIWFWLYLFNLFFAGAIALPLSNLLNAKIGKSMEVKELLKGFDFTVFSDFMLDYGDAVGVLMGQSIWAILFYLLLTIFLTGGILYACRKDTFHTDFSSFLSQSAFHFWRFLRLTAYFLIIHSIILFIFWKLFSLSVSGFDMKVLQDETVIYSRGKLFFILYLLVASVCFMWQDYTKIHIVQSKPKTVIKSMVESLKLLAKQFVSYWVLYALNALTFAIVFGLYWAFSSDDLNSTSSTILFALFFGQLFVFLRIGGKVLNLKSGTLLYEEWNKK